MRIGIDLMGSDTPPQVLFDAVLQIADQLDPSDALIVLATREVVEFLQSNHPKTTKARIDFLTVADVIAMADDPIRAVRNKKNSSLVKGIKLLRKKKIDAFVSAGNTGALIASATLSLAKLPGINRPALIALLPTQKGSVAVIDVGGNVSCKAHHLIQFAHMGAAYQRCNLEIDCPTIGLLNIGAESKKGTAEVRQAYQLLREQCAEEAAKGLTPRLHFMGNIEGKDIFEGKVDVLVTNGFTGNVLLKTTEGVASFIFDALREQGALEIPGINNLRQYFNYAEYPGAILCGVEGIVVKCHGYSSARAMYNSIRGAVGLVRKQLVAKIKTQLAS